MGVEIERKFLVNGDDWRALATKSVKMRQAYIANTPACSVRVRITSDEARLNMKSGTLGIERQEFDYGIPLSDAQEIVETLCNGETLAKTRHFVPHGVHLWEVDEFFEANAGLIVAELELEAVDTAYDKPHWIGEEVSHDERYYNVNLIKRPLPRW